MRIAKSLCPLRAEALEVSIRTEDRAKKEWEIEHDVAILFGLFAGRDVLNLGDKVKRRIVGVGVCERYAEENPNQAPVLVR